VTRHWLASASLALATNAGPAFTTAAAQETQPPPQAAVASAQQDADDDMAFNPAEPDFTIINLPTTLRLPLHRFAFRVTHRFTRDLGDGDFGDLLADFFGFDSGAQIGLELRFGLMRGWQVGINRTSDRTIEFFTQYSALHQREGVPLSVDAFLTAEGTNNFSSDDPNQPTGEGVRSPGLGAVVSHAFGRHGAVYAMPMWVNNTNPLPSELSDDNSTFLLGLGARVRIRPTVYLVGEFVPRVAGYDPNTHLGSFGVEKRVGGHSFQLNFSNGFGTTIAQVARGGIASDSWHIGFNITRKFY
jgi:hypothetical protein